MPLDTSIQTVLLLGSGPIVIGQACEFDYSGTQACRALREEGCRVVLVNSNPATIMTDPDMADVVYIEPLEWRTIAEIIKKEAPDAILPTMGGQTALNCVLDLDKQGVLKEYNVRTIGANIDAINKAENRKLFDVTMRSIGLDLPKSVTVTSLEEALRYLSDIQLPCIIRPSFTLGGSGGGIAYNIEEFTDICRSGLSISPIGQILIDESMLGWKEYEMEVVRDANDNCIIVCSIENLDPMGVHTGDSITVAPAQTLTDKEYQIMRRASLDVLRAIGVETGGSNVQFAIHPETGRMVVIEMNPRVSRSSALASKATGFPIAKVATKLALGYILDELTNDITNHQTPCSFEPTIDYVVTKIPKFSFEKFPKETGLLTTKMQSVGEVMGIGVSFVASLQKALRSLEESGCDGLVSRIDISAPDAKDTIMRLLGTTHYQRIFYVADALRLGIDVGTLYERTAIDRWFLHQIADIVAQEQRVGELSLVAIDATYMRELKHLGFADSRIAFLLGANEQQVRKHRLKLGVLPGYRRIDSCAAEFATETAYLYAHYYQHCEAAPSTNKKVIVIGSGPNRIGQGVEFDYCCVHAILAIKAQGLEAIMINCNPETVSTDVDISDRLYFEPITAEDILHIVAIEKPLGVVLQFGGQTPLKLAQELQRHNIPILGTQPDAIDAAEDRERFSQILHTIGLRQPRNAIAYSSEEALKVAATIGYPLVVRPSYVLGGRAMEIVYSDGELQRYMIEAVQVSNDSPVLLDQFLESAIEVDVDAISDGTHVTVAALMEHIEQAGVHSGDSACSLPPYSLSESVQDTIQQQTIALAKALQVVGLLNIQFAVQQESVYILEANPRASRTVPFVSKCVGVPLAQIAMKAILGSRLQAQNYTQAQLPKHYAVKEAVFPFIKFAHSDPLLGPEMKSTGEVMGSGVTFGEAFAKATLASGGYVPSHTKQEKKDYVFVSVKNSDKVCAEFIVDKLIQHGFCVICSQGTAKHMTGAGFTVDVAPKIGEKRPDISDYIKNKEVCFIINTIDGKIANRDAETIRRLALQHGVFYVTTIAAAHAVCGSLESAQQKLQVRSLSVLHQYATIVN